MRDFAMDEIVYFADSSQESEFTCAACGGTGSVILDKPAVLSLKGRQINILETICPICGGKEWNHFWNSVHSEVADTYYKRVPFRRWICTKAKITGYEKAYPRGNNAIYSVLPIYDNKVTNYAELGGIKNYMVFESQDECEKYVKELNDREATLARRFVYLWEDD